MFRSTLVRYIHFPIRREQEVRGCYTPTIIPIAPLIRAVLSERNGTIRPSYRVRIHTRTDPDKIREALFFGGIAASITSSQRSLVRNVSRRLFL